MIEQQTRSLKKFYIKFLFFTLAFFVVLFFGIFLYTKFTQTATCTWTGGSVTSTNWSDTANWSGCGSSGIPTSADIAFFDGTSTEDSTVDVGFPGEINDLDINVGYTGTISLQRTLIIDDFLMDDGNFDGGTNPSVNFIINNGWDQNAGNVTTTRGLTQVYGHFDIDGGTWYHNDGTLELLGSSTNDVFDVPTALSFANLTLNRTNGTLGMETNTGDVITVTGTFSLLDGAIVGDNTADILVQGDLQFAPTFNGGTGAEVIVTSTVSQTIVYPSGVTIPRFQLDAPNTVVSTTGVGSINLGIHYILNSGTVLLGEATVIINTFEQNGGVLDLGAGDQTFNNTVTVNGGTQRAGSGDVTYNNTLNVETANAHIDWSNAANVYLNGFVNIDAGIVTSTANNLYIRVNFDMDGGTFNHNNGTLVFDGTSTSDLFDVPGTITLNNVTIDHANDLRGPDIASGDNVTVEGTFTGLNGQVNGVSNFSNLYLQGPVFYGPNWDGGTGAMVYITSTLSQTIEFPTTAVMGITTFDSPNATISTTGSGTLLMESGFVLDSGTVNIGPVSLTINSGGANFVINDGRFNLGSGEAYIAPSAEWNGGLFDMGTSSSTFNSLSELQGGEIDMTNAGDVWALNTFRLMSGTITSTGATFHAQGDLDIDGGTFIHNNGTIAFDGNSILDVFDVDGSLDVYNLTINKTNGDTRGPTLNASETVTILGTMHNIQGQTNGVSTGQFIAKGPVIFENTWDGGAATTVVSSTASQTVTFPVGAVIGGFELDAPNTTVNTTGSGTVTMESNFTVTQGVVNFGSVNENFSNSSASILFVGGETYFGSGTTTFTPSVDWVGGIFDAGSSNMTFGNISTAQSEAQIDFDMADVTFVNSFDINSAGVNVTSTANTLVLEGAFDWNDGNFYHNNGTLRFEGTGSVDEFDVPTAGTFNNITIDRSNSNGEIALQVGDTYNVLGDVTLLDGDIDGSGTLVFGGSDNQTFSLAAGEEDGMDAHMQVDKSSGILYIASNITNDVTFGGRDYTFVEGVIDFQGNDLSMTDAESILTVEDGVTVRMSGQESFSFATAPTVDSGSTFYYYGATGMIADIGYHHLTVSTTGNTQVLTADTIIAGDLTIETGALFTDGYNLTVNGNVFNSGILRVVGSETFTLANGNDTDSGIVEYVGDGDTNADTFTIIDIDYYDLIVNTDDASDAIGLGNLVNSLESGLVAYWKLDDDTGSGTAADSSGNSNDGILVNMDVNTDWVSPATTTNFTNVSALDFDGANDHVILNSQTGFPTGLSARSACAWAKTDTVASGYRMIFAYGTGATGQVWAIGMNGTTLYGATWADDINSPGFWQTGVWKHVCFTYDGTTATLYGDGVELVSSDETWSLTSGNAFIGQQVNNSERWDGQIDDVRLYDRALTSAEVVALGANGTNTTAVDGLTIDINNDLTFSAGTMFGYESTLNVAGDIINNGGTFTANTSTVNLDGTDQTLSGNMTFYNFNKSSGGGQTLTFPSSETITFTGTMTLQGTNTSSQMVVNSSNSSLQAQIDPQGTRDVAWLDVTYNNNIDSTEILCIIGCTDSGNNTNWDFSGIPTPPVEGNSGNVNTDVDVDNTAPVVSSVIFTTSSGGATLTELNLIEFSTTSYYVRGSITDNNGCEDFTDDGSVTATIYRSGSGFCTSQDESNCYVSTSCSLSNCTAGGGDTTVDYECTGDVYYFADPTNGGGPFTAQDWQVAVDATDGTDAGIQNTSNFEMNSLVAINIGSTINYGALNVATTSEQVSLTITNTGNVTADTNVSGNDMVCDELGTIDVSAQRYASSSGAAYAAMTSLNNSSTLFGLGLPKQTVLSTLSTTSLYWRIQTPTSGVAGTCTSVTTLTAVEG